MSSHCPLIGHPREWSNVCFLDPEVQKCFTPEIIFLRPSQRWRPGPGIKETGKSGQSAHGLVFERKDDDETTNDNDARFVFNSLIFAQIGKLFVRKK